MGITNHTSTFETSQEITATAHFNEEQANAEYPTEFKKEKEVAKFSAENIDVENVTNISAQIYINGKTMATTNKSNATENIIENTITSRNEENTSIFSAE